MRQRNAWGPGWLLAVGMLTATSSARADELLSKLSVHGFLSQTYAHASDESATVVGITKDGTTDYRTAALQFSYAITEKDRLVVQLSHERIGIDPRAAFLPDVAADWIFYERRFSDSTRLKVGRVPIPLGIYNEIRDAGTLLAFYRPPNALYSETNFVSETIDGVVGLQRARLGRWELEVEPFAGGWNTLAISGATGLTPARATNVVGLGTWIQTPLSGLRAGATYFRSTLRRGLGTATPPAPEPRSLWMVSADGAFPRITARAEYSQTKDGDSKDRAYYGLLSVKVVPKLSVNAQYSKFWVSWFGGPRAGLISSGQRDLALGVSYAFAPNLVAKLEGHDGEGIGIAIPPPVNRYAIATLAVSF